ncbi:MAG: L-serine ammonia-lyase, iron-sulfur-dependent, subunit beta [Candidatus Lokiarchaeota archaeon]|nr:L-serine ammonia-lyase, iron-sulfur-dependent, subunit beta [Candidatus Lokiarchaeota archaeon]
MKYDSLFDVIGRIMVGPSSSHTAGACRIAYVTRQIFDKEIKNAKIILHGSFADTYKGHGTDKALIAGLLGIGPENDKLRQSFKIAKERGFDFIFHKKDLGSSYHPNTVLIEVSDEENSSLKVIGSSIGGGNIIITEIDDINAGFNADLPTFVIKIKDLLDEGVLISKINELFVEQEINYENLGIWRNKQTQTTLIWIETNLDEQNKRNILIEKFMKWENVEMVRLIDV